MSLGGEGGYGAGGGFGGLDAFTAKQMAALQATSLAKAGNRSAPGGTSVPYFGGLLTPQSQTSGPPALPPPDAAPPQLAAPPMAHPNPNAALHQMQQLQKRRQFLGGLAAVHSRSNPLPPDLVGVPWPQGYDPAASPWKPLDVSRADLGVIRLAGKDVDLYKLWVLVLQGGGGHKVNQQGLWPVVLRQLDLPEHFPEPQQHGQPVAPIVARYYMMIVGPFEEAYRRNMREQQMRAAAQQGPAADGLPGPSNMSTMPGMPADTSMNMGAMGPSMSSGSSQMLDSAAPNQISPTNVSHTPQLAQHSPVAGLNAAAGMSTSSSLTQHMTRSTSSLGPSSIVGQELNGADADQEANSRKRKLGEAEDLDPKRVRQKTGSADASDMRASVPPAGPQNGHAAQPTPGARVIKQPSRRKIEYVPLGRPIETAGGRDVEAIQHELLRASHRPLKDMNEWGQVDIDALTILMRYPHKDTGFPILQAPELLEEALDLLEDVAFDDDDDDDDASITSLPEGRIRTHKELVNGVVEEGSRPFAALEPKQGWRDPDLGPRPRTGETVLTVTNILRNLSNMADNQDHLAKHERLLSIILRLCCLDLLTLRKDVVHILVNIAGNITFSSASPPPKQDVLNARRAFELLASYLVDPVEAVPPFASMLMSGIPPAPDDNRRLLSRAVSQEWLWTLMESLVHRLPVSDNDFQVVMRDVWLGFVEKLVMAIYALAFLAPPPLKRRIKTDRSLGFAKVLLRLVKKFSIYSPPEARMYFIISVRRAIEAMRLVDDASDSFDTAQTPAGTTLMFGMGYGEHGESRPQRGMGLLSGYQDEITWSLMLQREVVTDDLMFSELESLVRVDKSTSVLPVS
ncbi:uncharacterized protein B0H18DRAFT_1113394 [Fomitopsis serialis]|uniref:uncharacterized protein n=1 Tax=Fomitopsis serialis TaxID=139415 RepID=UPI0020087262|nr:uncharacterized protein B0H18DRAFT_1113394 [Neoantrodia serialis]KAH9937577.1 hypothetical protein B0H18DRAFT_1113394 [Neoantrodia serialis]